MYTILLVLSTGFLFVFCKSAPSQPGTGAILPSETVKIIQSPPTEKTKPHKKPAPYFRYVSAHGGLRLREKPGRKEKTIGLARLNQKVWVIDEAKTPESIDGKTADWLFVEFKISEMKNKQGWVFGGFLSETAIEAVKPSDLAGFTEGCITSEDYCEGCNAATFSKSGKFHAFLKGCGEAGQVKGKWKLHAGEILVEAVVYPSCYDSCDEGMTLQQYQDTNKRNVTVQYYINEEGKIDLSEHDFPPWKREPENRLFLLPTTESW